MAAQIESVEGLKNIEAIAAVDGVTQLFFGPSDYSADAGVSIDSDHTFEVAAQVAKVAKAYGLHSGSVTFPQSTPQALAKLGFSHISVASDVTALSNSLGGSLRDAKG